MTDMQVALADHHAAVDEFAATARALDAAKWIKPRAQGAWSPGQVVEHLALTYEYNRDVIGGTAKRLLFPLMLLRPLIRKRVVTDTLNAGRFVRKGKAPAPFQPATTPSSQQNLIPRLTGAAYGFEADVRARGGDTIAHPAFGLIATVDWVKLQAIHTRHHMSHLE
jgi:hypothetical protein